MKCKAVFFMFKRVENKKNSGSRCCEPEARDDHNFTNLPLYVRPEDCNVIKYRPEERWPISMETAGSDAENDIDEILVTTLPMASKKRTLTSLLPRSGNVMEMAFHAGLG